MRPLIGISTYREQARWGSWDVPAVLLPASYADAVARAGGEPVLLPTGATGEAVVARLDGLVLAGGADVEPSLYGQVAGLNTRVMRTDRDTSELALLQAALGRDLPLLAICRGMQLLNTSLGGDLLQHLPDRLDDECHDPGPGLYADRTVRIDSASALHAVLGSTATAHCHHHQGLDRLAAGLVATAWAADGTVEAVELPGKRFCLAVQWHPEAGDDGRLFAAHVAAARLRRSAV